MKDGRSFGSLALRTKIVEEGNHLGYKAGEGSVDRYGGVPPYRETQGYVRRILGYLGLETAPKC